MNVEQIDINIHIPITDVNMVVMQPYIHFQSDTEEPFVWASNAVEAQLSAISRTLDIAQKGYNSKTVNFTIFPEYSVPGLAGAKIIDSKINDTAWGRDSVIIAGLDGLSKDAYSRLCRELTINVSRENDPSVLQDEQWVNCCIIWIKDEAGNIQKWVQLKIRPSWPECCVQCYDMFCGSTVYIFKAKYSNGCPCNFFTLICFDWVAADSGTTVNDEVLSELNNQWTGTHTPIAWAFIIQHNSNPNHHLFIDSTYKFLTDNRAYPFIDRKDAAVLHANTAVSVLPSRIGNGAFTSCVFSPSAQLDCTVCRPTICVKPQKLRNSDTLSRCKDVVFREMGECIHLFKVRVPQFVGANADDRAFPLTAAKVYPVNMTISDPRLCGSAVPAVTKWTNDSLDCIESLCANILLNCSLKIEAKTVQSEMTVKLRALQYNELDKDINLATCSYTLTTETRNKKRQLDKDIWDALEFNALEHVVYALTMLGLAYECTVKEVKLHGIITLDKTNVHIVAIRGDTYENCRRHYDAVVQKPIGDIVLAIFRDRDNFKPLRGEFQKITDVKSDNFMIVDYHSLVTCCRESENSEAFRRYIDDLITHEHRII